jgi:succinate dehydrogenase/fumarate reductase cytochrome b subunit
VESVEFNQEFGKMTALSWPVIVLPSTAVMIFALYHMANGLRSLTGLAWKEVLRIDDEADVNQSETENEKERTQQLP